MEESEVFRRIIEEKQTRKWRIIKAVSQVIVICIMVALFSLFIAALIVNRGHIESIRAMMITCVIVTEAVSAVGLILLAVWTQIR